MRRDYKNMENYIWRNFTTMKVSYRLDVGSTQIYEIRAVKEENNVEIQLCKTFLIIFYLFKINIINL